MKTIYVDNNATTKVDPLVLEEMLPFIKENYGNPSSIHNFGGKIRYSVEEAREKVASLIKAYPEEIMFTSCGTESDNTAILSAINSFPDKKHIITSKVEHPAVKNMYTHLSQKGYRTTFVPVDSKGRLNFDYLYDHLTEDTAIVSLMWANNETGVLFPIEEIAERLSEKKIIFHTDAVQASGKIDIDMKKVNVHLLSISGHKLYAPKGVGALYIHKGTRFTPNLIGGHQEGGRRGGTENVASIVGFGKACEFAGQYFEKENVFVSGLRDKLENEIQKRIPSTIINGDKENRLPGTTNISFEYVEGESIQLMLNELGVCASSGSACSSGSLEPSHVLRAMGVPYTAAHGSIRFSLGIYNTEEEIDFIIEKLPLLLNNSEKFFHIGRCIWLIKKRIDFFRNRI